MDYNKLKTFLVVAQKSSITDAAIELGRTQSAITQQIKLLEEELGFALFERKNARIFLTLEGERLVATGGKSLGQLDDEVARIKSELHAVEGSFSIGALEDYGTARLGGIIAAFRQRYPGIQIKVVFATSEAIESQLIANTLDMGLLITFTDKSFFDITPLRTDDHLLVTSSAYLKSHGPLKKMEQIIEADLIDFTEEYICIGTWVRKNRKDLLPRLLRRKAAVLIESHPGVKAIVAAGFGIGVLPRYLIDKELADGSLVLLMKSSQTIRAGLDLAVRKKHSERLVEKLFKEFLLSYENS